MTKKEIYDLVSKKENKYYELVWYARADRKSRNKVVREKIASIKKAYPHETDQLADPEMSDWQHGFHSGLLAGLRYVLTLNHTGRELADEEFPDLDS